MSWDWFWDKLIDFLMLIGMPLVIFYHVLTANPFLNIAANDATGLEKAGNQLLLPFQYLCGGKIAIRNPEKPDNLSWTFKYRCDYQHYFAAKTITSAISLPPSFILGTLLKGLAFIDPATRKRSASIADCLHSCRVESNLEEYQKAGLKVVQDDRERLFPEGRARRPGDENHLALEKEALRQVTLLLTEAKIPWWVDCGTCLGAYRYGGVIPWDFDIDIAVLLPDFHNVKRALNKLDPHKYIVQDWSTRDHPDSYVKVLVYETGRMIDIYHFAIEGDKLRYVFSLDAALFLPEWVKKRERQFMVPVAIDTVFPLKKSVLDGIEVFVPNKTKEYLQRYYGENLDPAKVYNPLSGDYEKDLTHPYWQRINAH